MRLTFLTVVLSLGLPAVTDAQELGGSLGGSVGVFRPINPKSSFSKNRKAASVRRFVAKTAIIRQPRRPAVNNAELVEAAIAQGNRARDTRNYTAAQIAYERAQQLNPRDARAFYGIGNLYVDQRRWDEAERSYRQALKINPKQADVNIALSYVLMQTNRSGNIAARFDEAEAAALRAIEIDAQNPMGYDRLGVSLELRGLIDKKTENTYRQAIKLDKTYAPAYAHLGRFLKKNGNSGESQSSYKKAVTLAEDVPTIILVAEVLLNEGRFDEAEKLLKKAARMDGTNPPVLLLLGQTLMRRGGFAEAETVLAKAVRLSPYSFIAHTLLGAVYLRQEKYEKAERTYTKALESASDAERRQLAGDFGFAGVGDGYMKMNRNVAALRVYYQALRLDGKNAQLTAKIAAAKGSGQQ